MTREMEDRINRQYAKLLSKHGQNPDSTFHQLELGPAPSQDEILPAKTPADSLIAGYHEGSANELANDSGQLLDRDSVTTVGALDGEHTAGRRMFWQKVRGLGNDVGDALVTGRRRLGNFMELAVGPTFASLMRMDNAWMAYLSSPEKPIMKDGKPIKVGGVELRYTDPKVAADRVWRAIAPDVYHSPLQTVYQESSDAAEKLTEIQDAGKREEKPGMWAWLDQEPAVFENSKRSATYQDAIIQRVFGGDEAAYGAWYQDQNAPDQFFHNAGFGVLDGIAVPSMLIVGVGKWADKVFNWPFFAAGKAVAKAASKTVVPAAAAVARKHPEMREGAMEVARIATQPLFKRRPADAADLGAIVVRREAQVQKLQEEYALNNSADLARKIAVAEKNAADARLKLANKTASLHQDPVLMRAPRAQATLVSEMAANDIDQRLNIRPSEYRKLRARRIDLANKIAPQAHVEEELKKVGFASWDDYLARMGNAHNAVKKGGIPSDPNLVAELNPIIEDMRRVERLPEEVKKHLSIRGLSRDKINSAAALMRNQADEVHPGEWADFTNPATLEQRLANADDPEVIGQALNDLTAGVSSEHVYVYDTVIPEYEILATGKRPVHANNIWIGNDNAIYENGQKVLQGDDYFNQFGDVALPGPKGTKSKVFNIGRLVKRGINPLRPIGFMHRSVQDMRQPMSAWGELPTARVLERATENQHTWHIASNETMEKTFTGLSDESVAKIRDAMNADDEFALEGVLAKMSDKEKTAYRKERARIDHHGDRLQLQRGEPLKNHFAHVFPHADMEEGNRVLELMGVDPKEILGFNHLLHRTGAEGYVQNYRTAMDIYHRLYFRKTIMEPAYRQARAIADVYRSRGMTAQELYSRRLIDAHRGKPQGLSYLVEWGLKQSGYNPKAADKAAATIGSLTYIGMLGGKLGYILENMTSGAIGIGAEHGALNTIRGALRLGTKQGRELAEKSGVLGQARHMMHGESGLVHKVIREAGKYSGASTSEDIIRSLAHSAALSDLVARSGKSWRQIVAEGKGHSFQAEAFISTLRTQHMYGQGGRSPYLDMWLGRRGSAFVTQFSQWPGYAYKQSEMLLRHVHENPSALLRYFAMGGLVLRAMEEKGIDAHRMTGMGYVMESDPSVAGLINSPEMNFMVEVQNINEAMAENDPEAMTKHTKRATDLVLDIIPGIGLAIRHNRAFNENRSGRAETAAGKGVRELEEGEGRLRQLGLPTQANRVANQIREQQQEQIKDWYYQRKIVTERFIDMVDNEDYDEAQRYAEKMTEMGFPLSQNLYQAKTQAQYIGAILNTQMKYKSILPPELLDRMNMEGQILEP